MVNLYEHATNDKFNGFIFRVHYLEVCLLINEGFFLFLFVFFFSSRLSSNLTCFYKDAVVCRMTKSPLLHFFSVLLKIRSKSLFVKDVLQFIITYQKY